MLTAISYRMRTPPIITVRTALENSTSVPLSNYVRARRIVRIWRVGKSSQLQVRYLWWENLSTRDLHHQTVRDLNVGASMSHACRAEMNLPFTWGKLTVYDNDKYQQSITRLKSYRRYFFSAFFFVELWVRSGGGVEVEKRDVFCVRWVKKLKTRWIFFQPEDILVKVLLVSN